MSDASPESRLRRLRDSIAQWSTLCAEGEGAVDRLILEANAAIEDSRSSGASSLSRAAEAGEWSKLIEELETRLAEKTAAERTAREESRRLESEIQELRRAKRDLERDSRNARHELENLKASLDEAADEREFARRRLEKRVEELEAENRRLRDEAEGRRGAAPPPAPEAGEQVSDAEDDSPVRRALKSFGKKR